MGKKFSTTDLSKMSDDKALAIAAFGESVAAYRYIVLSEKARDAKLRDSFERMAADERKQRDRMEQALQHFSSHATNASGGGYYLTPEDKLAVSVGPRLVDARDGARFDEAMKMVIASEKRSTSFYMRYAKVARDPNIQQLFNEYGVLGLAQVQRLRSLLKDAGKEISEPCPVVSLRMG